MTPFPFETLVVFGFLSVMLLAGVVLRAYIPFLQKMLFPASLIGGLLGLILINLGLISLDIETIKSFAYHFFNISFISVGLTPPDIKGPKQKKERKVFKGSLWMAMVQAVSFPLQALTGALITLEEYGKKPDLWMVPPSGSPSPHWDSSLPFLSECP
jgi:ESS family glutamate:Na+ symporter